MRGRPFDAAIAFLSVLMFVTTGCPGDDSHSSRADGGPTDASQLATTMVATTSSPTTSPTNTALTCSGDGTVPVVLLAGGTDPSTVWTELLDQLGTDIRTCRFDPPGIGNTSPADQTVTATQRAEALAEALTSAGIDQPIVLAAHSLGGLIARRFGTLYPDRLAGAVLLDPTTRLGLLSLREELTGLGWDADATIAETENPAPWPEVPLIVLSHDPTLLTLGSEHVETLWSEGQQEYLALTPSSRREIVTGSGHYVYRDSPTVVIDALREVVGGV